jgi:hypothetical protein
MVTAHSGVSSLLGPAGCCWRGLCLVLRQPPPSFGAKVAMTAAQRAGVSRGIIVRQGVVPLRKALPDILSSNTSTLSPRMVNLIAELVQDWRRLDERIAAVSTEPAASNRKPA